MSAHKGFALPLIIGIVIALTVLGTIAYMQFKPKPSSQTNDQNIEISYASQDECEAKTGKTCSFYMCDVVPEGKTFEETCGKGFKASWKPKSQTKVDETTDTESSQSASLLIVQLVKKDLSELLKIPENSIAVLSVKKAEWPDSCLGVDTGELCAQVITPGYKISLKGTGERIYIYHTDLNKNFIIERPVPGNL